jgi:hypothetical protein
MLVVEDERPVVDVVDGVGIGVFGKVVTTGLPAVPAAPAISGVLSVGAGVEATMLVVEDERPVVDVVDGVGIGVFGKVVTTGLPAVPAQKSAQQPFAPFALRTVVTHAPTAQSVLPLQPRKRVHAGQPDSAPPPQSTSVSTASLTPLAHVQPRPQQPGSPLLLGVAVTQATAVGCPPTYGGGTVQSPAALQLRPAAQNPQPLAAPQSTSVSTPLRTPSVHCGTGELPHAYPQQPRAPLTFATVVTHCPTPQSADVLQPNPRPHLTPQTAPQSTSLSPADLTPLLQLQSALQQPLAPVAAFAVVFTQSGQSLSAHNPDAKNWPVLAS